MTDAAVVLAFVPDLMDRSKLAAAGAVEFVHRPGDLAGRDADVVIVDLSRPGVLAALPSISAKVIGFASHVDADLMEAARGAGCDEVLARSVFFARIGRPEFWVR